jgi:AcrR family transcriptional regulator
MADEESKPPSRFPITPRREPTQTRAIAAMEAILDATASLLVSVGYDALTTTQVAAAAGVSVGSVYQYFPNKAALVTAVGRRHSERMLEVLQEAALRAGTGSLPEVVRVLCDALLRAHRVNAALNRVMVQQVPQLGLDHREGLERAARVLVRSFLGVHAKKQKLVVQDLDTASFVLVALVEGIGYAAILAPDDAPPLEAVAEEMVAVVLRYLLGSSQGG